MEHADRDRTFLDAETLADIRQATDWRALFTGLGIRKCDRRSKEHDWWGFSPFKDEKTPSFHMSEGGRWFDFAIGEGGGIIELVQRLENVDCYEAGRIILDNNWAVLPGESGQPRAVRKRKRGKTESASGKPKTDPESRVSQTSGSKDDEPVNKPIRQDLLPLLSEQGTHPEFARRGISEQTCKYLGCGFLPSGRSRLKNRIVFQVRGVEETEAGGVAPTILTHIGRATTSEQVEKTGKWLVYPGFKKTHELYNIDELLISSKAQEQIRQTGRVVVVEGPFDVAKCVEAGIHNVVATFGADLSEHQLPRFDLIAKNVPPAIFVIWFDRDDAGRLAQVEAMEKLYKHGFQAAGFDWERAFIDATGRAHTIPETLTDPCDMSAEQLQWLRAKSVI